MTKEGSDRIRGLLYAGKIHGYNGAEKGEYGYVTPGKPGDMNINRTFEGVKDPFKGSIFNNPVQLPKTLLHESEHIEQYKGLNELARLMLNTIGRNAMEAGAYRYEAQNYIP